MVANIKAGKLPNGSAGSEFVAYSWGPGFGRNGLKLPDGVSVERDGREALFKAWPYRNVTYSAWEFLRRQGVIWSAWREGTSGGEPSPLKGMPPTEFYCGATAVTAPTAPVNVSAQRLSATTSKYACGCLQTGQVSNALSASYVNPQFRQTHLTFLCFWKTVPFSMFLSSTL